MVVLLAPIKHLWNWVLPGFFVNWYSYGYKKQSCLSCGKNVEFLSWAKQVTLFQRPFIFFTIPHGPHSFVNKKNGSILRPYHTRGGGGGGGGGAKMVSHANLL